MISFRILIHLAFRNLFRNTRRNVATGLALAFGYIGLVLFGAYIVRVEHYLRVNTVYLNHAGHVSIYKKDGLEKLLTKPSRYSWKLDEQEKLLAALTQFPEVEFAARYLQGVGLASNGCYSVPFIALGIESQTEQRIRRHPEVLEWTPELNHISRGRIFSEYGQKLPEAIQITNGLAELLSKDKVYDDLPQQSGSPESVVLPNCGSADTQSFFARDANIQLVARSYEGDFSAVDAEVASHFTTGLALSEDTGLRGSLDLLQKLFATDRVSYVAAFLKPEVSWNDFSDKLKAKLISEGIEADVRSFSDERIGLFYVSVVNFLVTLASFFYTLIFGVIIVSIINFITVSVMERRREIGTMRAIGFDPKQVIQVFSWESNLLSLIAIVIGLIASLILAFIVNHLNIRFTPPGIAGDMQFMLVLNPMLCLGAGLAVWLISWITAYFVMRRRSTENIVNLLQG